MVPFPKPRGFWDYALFTLIMSVMLLLLFWSDASNGVSWLDIAFAISTGALFTLVIIITRRGEKAMWIAQSNWHVRLLAALGTCVLMFGATYADAYLVHHTVLTSKQLHRDMMLAVVLIAVLLWSTRRGHFARRQLL